MDSDTLHSFLKLKVGVVRQRQKLKSASVSAFSKSSRPSSSKKATVSPVEGHHVGHDNVKKKKRRSVSVGELCNVNVNVNGNVNRNGNVTSSAMSRKELFDIDGLTTVKSMDDYNGSKPLMQAVPACVDVKEILCRAGWEIRVEEERTVYISPRGRVYHSLVKALDTIKPAAFVSGKFGENEGIRRGSRITRSGEEEEGVASGSGSERHMESNVSRLEESEAGGEFRSMAVFEDEVLPALGFKSGASEEGEGFALDRCSARSRGSRLFRLEESEAGRESRSMAVDEEELVLALWFKSGDKEEVASGSGITRKQGSRSSRLVENEGGRKSRLMAVEEEVLLALDGSLKSGVKICGPSQVEEKKGAERRGKSAGPSKVEKVVALGSDSKSRDKANGLSEVEENKGGRKRNRDMGSSVEEELGCWSESMVRGLSQLEESMNIRRINRSVGCIDEKIVNSDPKPDSKLGNDEKKSSKLVSTLEDSLSQKPESWSDKVRIQVLEDAKTGTTLKILITDGRSDHQSKISDTCFQGAEVHEAKKSIRINGIHVPIDSEMDIEVSYSAYNSNAAKTLDPVAVESNKEVSRLANKRRSRKVLASGASEKKGTSCERSCTTDTSLSNETSGIVVKDYQNVNGDKHQDDVRVEVRRSNRINGKHILEERRVDTEIVVVEDTVIISDSKKVMVDEECELSHKISTDQIQLKNTNTPTEKELPSFCKKNTPRPLRTLKHLPSSVSKRKSSSGGFSTRKKKKRRSGGCGLNVRKSGKGSGDEYVLPETKVNLLSWLIDFGVVDENEKVACKTDSRKRKALKGSATRKGIRCNCCKKVLSLSKFAAHGGSDPCKSWKSICLISSGKSLMQCQIEAWEKEKIQRKIGFKMVDSGNKDPSDDTCGICADGGDLMLCDGCVSTFHQECLNLKSLPEGNWYCPLCKCSFCRLSEFERNESHGEMELLTCCQCWCKYHINCDCEKGMEHIADLSSSYCERSCEEVASGLSRIVGGSNSLENISWTLLRHSNEAECSDLDQKDYIVRCNAKLALAQLVLSECFNSLVDTRTDIDMIAQAVYNCGSNFNRLSCDGFHCVILEKDDEIISVATLRVHGTRVAEIPFIGTRPLYRRKGMCRLLLNAIEVMLASLHVEKLILPAIPDMMETWTKSFSFKPLETSQKDEMKNLNLMVFNDATLLQKPIYNKTY